MKFRSGDILIDASLQQVFKSGREISLSPLTYRLLYILMKSPLQVVTSDQLATKVWERHAVSDEAISQRVSLLRKAIGETERDYIESVRGRGYRWKQVVEPINQECRPTWKPRFSVVALASAVFIGVIATALLVRDSSTVDEVEIFKRTIQFSAESHVLEHAQRYQSHFNEKGFSIARDLYRQLLNEQPDSYEARFGLATTLLHRVAKYNSSAEELREAGAFADELYRENPSGRDTLRLKAFYYDVKGELDEAILWYEKALAAEPHHSSTKSSLAYLYTRKGRLHDALQLNLNSLEIPQHYGILQIAEILYLSGFWDEADRLFYKADMLSPDSAFASSGRAQFLIASGRDSEAKEVIRQAFERGVNTHDLHLLEGILHTRSANWLLAEESFGNALKHAPESLHARAWSLWLRLKDESFKDEVTVDIEGIADIWPNVWVSKAIHAVAMKQYGDARRYLENAAVAGLMDVDFLNAMPPFSGLREELDLDRIEATIRRRAQAERVKILAYAWPRFNGGWPRE